MDLLGKMCRSVSMFIMAALTIVRTFPVGPLAKLSHVIGSILSENLLPLKRGKIRSRLLLMTNRKSHKIAKTVTPPLFHPNFGDVSLGLDGRCRGSEDLRP